MSGRTLGILALIAVIAICAALLVQSGTRTPSATPGGASSEAVLVPGLMDKLDAVAQVRITDAAGTIELTKDPTGTWHDQTNDGYPAKAQAISQLVLALANAGPGEPKTDDPALYAEIGVEDPAPGPSATVIELKDAAGAVLATVIFGKKSERVPGERFVRIVGIPRTRQIMLHSNPTSASREWVEAQLVRIPRERVSAITVQPMDAPAIEVEQVGDDPHAFIVRGFDGPISKEPLGAMSQLTSSLGWLQFQDVRKAAGDPPSESMVTTTYRMRDGWSIEIVSWPDGEDRWARIRIIDPATAPEGDGGARLAAELAALKPTVTGWEFKLYPPQYDTIRPTLEALTAPAAAPPPESQEATP